MGHLHLTARTTRPKRRSELACTTCATTWERAAPRASPTRRLLHPSPHLTSPGQLASSVTRPILAPHNWPTRKSQLAGIQQISTLQKIVVAAKTRTRATPPLNKQRHQQATCTLGDHWAQYSHINEPAPSPTRVKGCSVCILTTLRAITNFCSKGAASAF
ncbi:unnamed protein product [Linum trigynum]|uniref:Uncharacterized protein n=1 Tax=Linum trigynum TaxID=586398 RepID=A0AAV2FPL7_9ROSI